MSPGIFSIVQISLLRAIVIVSSEILAAFLTCSGGFIHSDNDGFLGLRDPLCLSACLTGSVRSKCCRDPLCNISEFTSFSNSYSTTPSLHHRAFGQQPIGPTDCIYEMRDEKCNGILEFRHDWSCFAVLNCGHCYCCRCIAIAIAVYCSPLLSIIYCGLLSAA